VAQRKLLGQHHRGFQISAPDKLRGTSPVTYRIALFVLAILVAVMLAANFSRSRVNANSTVVSAQNPTPQQGQVDRGRYLVDQVGQCGECHSPRDANNNPDRSRWLQGAPVWITPVRPDPQWAERVPAIAGMLGYTDNQMQKILEQGIGPNGFPLRRPMHQYHLKHEDTMAIIAYLKSLPIGSSPQ
jgi:mono/diheme cytochrome c family protein